MFENGLTFFWKSLSSSEVQVQKRHCFIGDANRTRAETTACCHLGFGGRNGSSLKLLLQYAWLSFLAPANYPFLEAE